MQRKQISALIIAILALFCVGSASASVLFSDDFNRADSGTIGNDWVEQDNAGGSSITSNALLQSSTTTLTSVNHNVTYGGTTVGRLTVYASHNSSTAADSWSINAWQGLPSNATSSRIFQVALLDTGNIVVFNQTSSSTIVSYIKGTKQQIIVKNINFATRRYDIEVNGITYDNSGAHYTMWNGSGSDITNVDLRNGAGSVTAVSNTTYVCLDDGVGCYGEGVEGISFTAYDYNTGAPVYPFTVTFSNGSTQTNSTGNTLYFNYTNGNYTVNVTATGYITNTTSFEHINYTSFSMYLRNNNFAGFTVRDEVTNAIITNISYSLRGLTALNGTTTNGSFSVTSLQPGTYEIRYSAFGPGYSYYNTRSYYFFIPLVLDSQSNVTLRLINASQSDPVVLTVTDEYTRVIRDSYVSVLRYYDSTQSYNLVEMAQCNFNGQCPVDIVLNTVAYRFNVYQNNTLLFTSSTPTFLFSQEYSIRPTLGTSSTQTIVNLRNMATLVTYNNVSHTFSGTFSGRPASFPYVCLRVTTAPFRGTQYTNNTCSTEVSATIVIPVDNTTGATYYASIIAYDANGNGFIGDTETAENIIDSPTTDLNTKQRAAAAGIILVVLIFGVILASQVPLLGLGLIVLTLAAAGPALFGLNLVSSVWAGTIFILGIIALMLSGL